MIARILCLITAFYFFAVPVNAQTAKCGTVIPPNVVARELANPDTGQLSPTFVPNKCFGKTLSITAHIVLDSLGDPGVAQASILASIQTLNFYFEPICLQFQVCQFNLIPNYKYNDFLKTTEEAELLTLYSVPNTINVFYANRVFVQPGMAVGGYAYLPGGPDLIMISKSSLSAITHEMGHFFGLYHTFETLFGSELVNGSNCTTAGDLICDTPADPGSANTPAPDCQLSPYSKDANNEWYVPMIGNIMSYYTEDCTCGFTRLQYNRMASQYLNNRFYLW